VKRPTATDFGLAALCAALNVGVGALVASLKLPLYLDSIGTVLAAVLAGWPIGVLTGLVSLVVMAFVSTPTAIAYAGTAIVIAVLADLFGRYRYLKSFLLTPIWGFLLGIASAFVSAPVTTYLYGGISFAGADAVTTFFKTTGHTLAQSVIFGGLATDPVDKLATSIVALGLAHLLPSKLLLRFSKGARLLRVGIPPPTP